MASTYLRLKTEDGSVKEFRKESIKARWIKEGFKHSAKLDELAKEMDGSERIIDERIDFTCRFFGDKELTPDAILDGLENDELIPELDRIYEDIMGKKRGAEGV